MPTTLKCLKPKETDFEPRTLGEHIKKKRLEIKLTQREAGEQLGVTLFTVINWEYGVRKPAIRHLPAIRQFLGYNPEHLDPKTIAERLRAKRRELGWSQKEAAQRFGVDPSTWSNWEAGSTVMTIAHRRLLAKFVGVPEAEVYAAMRKRWNDSHGRPTRTCLTGVNHE